MRDSQERVQHTSGSSSGLLGAPQDERYNCAGSLVQRSFILMLISLKVLLSRQAAVFDARTSNCHPLIYQLRDGFFSYEFRRLLPTGALLAALRHRHQPDDAEISRQKSIKDRKKKRIPAWMPKQGGRGSQPQQDKYVSLTDLHARDNLNSSNPKVPAKYNSQDNGPYVVYVYDMNREKSIYPTIISSIITKAGIPDIQKIKKINKGKIIIEAKTVLAANRLIDNPIFSKHNLKAFIPVFRVLRVGVIQDVSIEIDLEAVLRHIEVPRNSKILDIHSLNRKTTKEAKLNIYPQRYCTTYEVCPFVPRICFACYRVGHIAKYARASQDAFIVRAIDTKREPRALILDV
ncbi:hypothetical protein G5I_02671 [Acromyrmex echinatior]|uniref:Uncharacterized protein n=1 Tax=Acromyrmex echinatior TaxID=103372 RepID=F4WAX6_ACREC|nr:hypothetical protein G5I_02671 [Acromyrmex echinatior]